MMSRTQITLENELQRQAHQRASEMGVSFAEYVRRLVARDLVRPETKANLACVFDLGASGGSDIATEKDSMLAAAFASDRGKPRRKNSRPL
jgi:hypothetical protein